MVDVSSHRLFPSVSSRSEYFTRPLLAFALIAFLTGSAALFLVESMASIEGNQQFEAAIEFSTLAHLFLGNGWHLAVQFLLYVALQTLIVTSLIESFQVRLRLSWNQQCD
jgi:phosphate starvation-inducible membrane PsiE